MFHGIFSMKGDDSLYLYTDFIRNSCKAVMI